MDLTTAVLFTTSAVVYVSVTAIPWAYALQGKRNGVALLCSAIAAIAGAVVAHQIGFVFVYLSALLAVVLALLTAFIVRGRVSERS